MAVEKEVIINKIFIIRGKKVMIDRDLAELYGVETKVLNQAIKRNFQRFPIDFMFRLNNKEKNKVVTICDHLDSLKYSYSLPLAFTEHGILMLSSVLNSERAIQINIQIMRSFIKLREMLATNGKLKIKIEEMEKKYDKEFSIVFEAIKQLIGEDEEKKEKKQIGYKIN